MTDVIILAGGDISKKLHFIRSRSKSPALIPVNTRLLAAYVIDSYRKLRNARIFVVIERSQQSEVEAELSHYSRRVTFVGVSSTKGVVDTLKAALKKIDVSSQVIVNLVTTIPTRIPALGEVQISEETTETDSWSSVSVGNVVTYYPKNAGVSGPGNAFTGVFSLKSKVLKMSLAERSRSSDLMSIVENAAKISSIRFVKTKWLDCGHEINYYDSRAHLISSRSFNRISVSPEKGVLCKSSRNYEKLKAEAQYMLALPPELSIYYPRIMQNYSRSDGGGAYSLEYYGYPNLSEYFLYWNLTSESWRRMFCRMKSVLKEFSRYPFSIGKNAYLDFYFQKTIDRVEGLRRSLGATGGDTSWITSPVAINGIRCRPFVQLETYIKQRVSELYSERDFGVMHGDFCFNNILYDVPTGIIRLIDPRGSFGEGCLGVYGDRKYDLAKLLHSAVGGYDCFANDLFTIKSVSGGYAYSVNSRKTADYISQLCRALISDLGYSYSDVEFISGLLFVSMAKLHSESPERQKALFLHGLRILNEHAGVQK